MISLHSCFVAGLTLMYCVWRDRSLFSYDVFEATQACSQSLTIFGEKWSGAVKYRDIFDALSGSLFKTLVNPLGLSKDTGLGVGSASRQHPLNARFDVNSAMPTASVTPETRDEEMEEPNMRNLMSDAVKEAFMEVDEEAPGGWQGWRMWNEMLGEAASSATPQAMSATNEAARFPQNEDWSGANIEGQMLSDMGMMQNDQYSTLDANGWDFGSV